MTHAAHRSETELDGCPWFDLVVPSGCSLTETRSRLVDFLDGAGIRAGEDADRVRDPEAAATLLFDHDHSFS